MLTSPWQTVEAHEQCKRGPTDIGQSRRRYVFSDKDEANREIHLIVMAVNMATA